MRLLILACAAGSARRVMYLADAFKAAPMSNCTVISSIERWATIVR